MKPGVEEFLAEKRIAVVGVSRTKGIGNMAFSALAGQGYEVFPVNALAETVEGRPCFKNLSEIPGGVGSVLFAIPGTNTLGVVNDCIRLGVKNVWMLPGTDTKEAIETARGGNMNVVHHACILMYAGPKGIHRLHRGINKILGIL